MSDAEGTPTEEWTHDQIDDWADQHGIYVEGTKAEKLAMIEDDYPVIADSPQPVDEPVDKWAEGGFIPKGARGPTIARLRERMEMPEGDKFDAAMQARVRYFQRWAGLPYTSGLDERTRRLLGG